MVLTFYETFTKKSLTKKSYSAKIYVVSWSDQFVNVILLQFLKDVKGKWKKAGIGCKRVLERPLSL